MTLWEVAAVAVPLLTFSSFGSGHVTANTSAATGPSGACHYRVVGVHPGGTLHVRSGPGARYGVVAKLPPNARVDGACSSQHGWVQLRAGGGRGWAADSYLANV
ncbi:SH3 domain-containing protein [Actinomadura gamaensis]|uniref:SH3 domain-containing protein n=1 Tax=Actinomadura gamaensis TaxID=1763541 RepID=A0ABV9U0W9_9ACTN